MKRETKKNHKERGLTTPIKRKWERVVVPAETSPAILKGVPGDMSPAILDDENMVVESGNNDKDLSNGSSPNKPSTTQQVYDKRRNMNRTRTRRNCLFNNCKNIGAKCHRLTRGKNRS